MKTLVQNLWDTAEVVLRGRYIASLKKVEKSQIHTLLTSKGPRERRAKQQAKPSRGREIIKVRAEINEIETRKTVE